MPGPEILENFEAIRVFSSSAADEKLLTYYNEPGAPKLSFAAIFGDRSGVPNSNARARPD